MQSIENLATEENVPVKSSPGTCENPFMMMQALNLIRLLCPSYFSQNTIWLPITFLSLGNPLTTSKTLSLCNCKNSDCTANSYCFECGE